jgi:hypothetical protein
MSIVISPVEAIWRRILAVGYDQLDFPCKTPYAPFDELQTNVTLRGDFVNRMSVEGNS